MSLLTDKLVSHSFIPEFEKLKEMFNSLKW